MIPEKYASNHCIENCKALLEKQRRLTYMRGKQYWLIGRLNMLMFSKINWLIWCYQESKSAVIFWEGGMCCWENWKIYLKVYMEM